MRPKVSIIVPVYNMELHLQKCLDSIFAQRFKDFEVICVNDGSTDKSQEILDDYTVKDARIHVLTKPNGGLVSARKSGVAVAQGEYIGFVDSDDWVEPEMFGRLYEEAKTHDADLVSSGYIQEGNYVSVAYDSIEEGVYSSKRMDDLRCRMILDFSRRGKGIGGSLCTKLIRSGILKKVLPQIPSEITLSEDKATSISVLLECDTAVIMHTAYYHYIMRSSSMTQTENPQYLVKVNCFYQYLTSLYSHPRFTDLMKSQAELYIVQLLIKGINGRLGFSIKNLLWIDPYWLRKIPEGASVALYGGGNLGEKYVQQLKTFGKHNFVALVDYNCAKMHGGPVEVFSPAMLHTMNYDYLIITIKDKTKAVEIKNELKKDGIDESKIGWFPQDEIFWRFAEAEGLLAEGMHLCGGMA